MTALEGRREKLLASRIGYQAVHSLRIDTCNNDAAPEAADYVYICFKANRD
jgi:hypothetical protein